MSETEPPKSKAEFLHAELEKHIKTFCEDRQSNKRKAFHLKIWGTVFSAITTILLGLQGFDHWTTYLKNSALALSAFVTVFAAWDAFFNHRALWVHYKSIQMELEAVLAELDYLLADSNGSPKSEDVDALFCKYQQVLKRSTQSWLDLRDDKTKKLA